MNRNTEYRGAMNLLVVAAGFPFYLIQNMFQNSQRHQSSVLYDKISSTDKKDLGVSLEGNLLKKNITLRDDRKLKYRQSRRVA